MYFFVLVCMIISSKSTFFVFPILLFYFPIYFLDHLFYTANVFHNIMYIFLWILMMILFIAKTTMKMKMRGTFRMLIVQFYGISTITTFKFLCCTSITVIEYCCHIVLMLSYYYI